MQSKLKNKLESNMIDKLVGSILIILGVLQLRRTYKNPIKDDYGANNFKGYIAGFFMIVIGVLQIIGYFGKVF